VHSINPPIPIHPPTHLPARPPTLSPLFPSSPSFPTLSTPKVYVPNEEGPNIVRATLGPNLNYNSYQLSELYEKSLLNTVCDLDERLFLDEELHEKVGGGQESA
jgi:hypothetical protein